MEPWDLLWAWGQSVGGEGVQCPAQGSFQWSLLQLSRHAILDFTFWISK